MTKSIDEILADDDAAYVRVVTARLPRIRQELRDEHAELDALLPTLVSDTIDEHPQRQATLDRIAEIEAEIEADAVEVKLRSIGHRAWADLLRKHPPTRTQLSADRQLDHNPETFPTEAIAASLDPPRTAEWVEMLVSKPWFNEECWSELWSKCLQVNVVDPAPKSAAASILRLSAESSRRPTTIEFPEASSSVE